MFRLVTKYFIVCGILLHLGLIAVAVTARYYFNEPLLSFLDRASGSWLKNHHSIRNNVHELIGYANQTFTMKRPLEAFPKIEQWPGQGARPDARYSEQQYTPQGIPLSSVLSGSEPYGEFRKVTVGTSRELIEATKGAIPGTVIQLKPGIYRFTGRNIAINRGGERHAPIILRSPVLGEARLEFSLLEGFHVKAPYWVFENLLISGTCDQDSACEHAFHVVEKGRSFVLRNSIIRDFNAAIKVNGVNNQYPDNGLVEYSTFYNTRPRGTENPVSLLNINSSDHWRIRGNLLADFFKTRGDRISYAAYMKGNGSQGIFEQNLVVCEMNLNPDSTTQVGLSFGGGGTARQYCRDLQCLTEHTGGIMRNNIILNCSNDVGIYLNRSAQTQIYNNAILNSLGIDVRFETSTATIVNNIVAGRIQDREGGYSLRENNLVDLDCMKPGFPIPFNCSFENWFQAPYRADLAIKNGQSLLGRGIEVEELTEDFCGNKTTPPAIDIGPIQYSNGESCLPLNMNKTHNRNTHTEVEESGPPATSTS